MQLLIGLAILRAAQWLWALPLTLCALPLWLFVWLTGKIFESNHATAQVFIAQRAIIFIAYSPAIAWLLKHHPFGEMQAVAVGCCVLAQDAQMLERTLSHELVHVKQALQWGPLFPLAYAACSAWAHATGRWMYADNYFEKQAQRGDS